jgi:hypothetical protein
VLYTTRRLAIRAGTCIRSYLKVRRHLGKDWGLDTPIGLDVVLEIAGLDDALWALQCVFPEQEPDRDRMARLFACECAERVLPLYERDHPDDHRPRIAIEMARRFAVGKATWADLYGTDGSEWAPASATCCVKSCHAAEFAARRAAAVAASRDMERSAQAIIFLRLLRETPDRRSVPTRPISPPQDMEVKADA